MPEEVAKDKAKGEPLAEYIKRLEILTGTPRVRVPPEWLDKHGNLFLPPQAIYLVDTGGDVHESADTGGLLPVNTLGIGAGAVRQVGGTYTKNATGTDGIIEITPAADDVLYFMYGWITIGGTRVGGADRLWAGIAAGSASNGLVQAHVNDSGANANEVFYLPALGEVNTAPQATSGVYHRFQDMMVSSSLHTTDSGTKAPVRYLIELQGMASAETFLINLFFLSASNQAVAIDDNNGVLA